MPTKKSITFRSQTLANIADLISDEGLNCHASQALISAVVGELLGYQEEGVKLSPTVLFCCDIAKVLMSFPGAVRHIVGSETFATESIRRILKECAPLATNNWCIFIERFNENSLRYGVFYYFSLPSTLPLAEAMLISQQEVCLLIQKSSYNTVDIRGSKGNVLAVVFSTVREEQGAQVDQIGAFANDCCEKLPPAVNLEGFSAYFERLIRDVLVKSHGTILVCLKSLNFDTSSTSELGGGISIDPCLDFGAAFAAYRDDNSVASLLKLQSHEGLLSGILQCDGVVVFNPVGCVVAYRAFYEPATKSAAAIKTAVVGGARRRAFEGLKGMIGKSLVSVLFRSQDGITIYKGGDR